jgi:hypothetical protein
MIRPALDLTSIEKTTLDEISDLEIRLAHLREVIVDQVQARMQPPRSTLTRQFMR